MSEINLFFLKNSQTFIKDEPLYDKNDMEHSADNRYESRKRKNDNLDFEQSSSSKRFRSSEEQGLNEVPPRASVLRMKKPLKRKNEEEIQVNRSVSSRYEDIDDDKIDKRIWEIPSDSE